MRIDLFAWWRGIDTAGSGMVKLAQIVCLTEEKRLPQAVSEMLPLPDARKRLAEIRKSGEWPGKARRPVLELRGDDGATIDPGPEKPAENS